jgi:SAM-dependent methyltransferase
MTDQINRSSAVEKFMCCICQVGYVAEIPEYRELRRITSDCRAWPAGGFLGVCDRCGAAQKPADATFVREINDIYASYAIYSQGLGAEQAVFTRNSGLPESRSVRLLELLKSQADLPKTGRMLDVGCGNGATLRAFGSLFDEWTMAGTELNDTYRKEVESIPRTEPLHVCSAESVPGTFDLITMIHVLEHVIEPVDFLRSIRAKLAPGGLLLVEVPHHLHNPFELLIADHRSHFTLATLGMALNMAGYEILVAADDWMPRELFLVARVASQTRDGEVDSPVNPQGARQHVVESLQWLKRTASAVRSLASAAPIGLFGTSIAGTWICAEVGDGIDFFVDEDPHRIGLHYLGKPIRSPQDVPKGSRVFVGLPSAVAAAVCSRLGIGTYIPPPA